MLPLIKANKKTEKSEWMWLSGAFERNHRYFQPLALYFPRPSATCFCVTESFQIMSYTLEISSNKPLEI